MTYEQVKLKYYNGGQYNKSVIIRNTEQDFVKFCGMIRKGQFIPPARQNAYKTNLDNLIIWLDSQYCSVDMFLNNLFVNMFSSGQDLVSLLSVLQKDNATDKDFNELEII